MQTACIERAPSILSITFFIMNISQNSKTYLIISIGLVSISTASLLIRWAEEVPTLIIAAYRLSVAALILAGISMKQKSILYDLSNHKELLLTLAAGVALSLHFIFWIESLRLTSVASSVVLVLTSPIWTAVISHFFLKETLEPNQIYGILVAIIGVSLIAFSGTAVGSSASEGNLLALLGGVMAGIYLSLGRILRRNKGVIAYSGSVYLTAAVILVLMAVISGRELTGYSFNMYILLLMIGIIPQLLGHTSFNWALKHSSAVSVSVLMLGEPVGATLLAALFLREIPSAGELFGGGILLTGIYLSTKQIRGENV